MNDSEWMRVRNETLALWPETERKLHQYIVDGIAAAVLSTDIEGTEVLKVLDLVTEAVKRSLRSERRERCGCGCPVCRQQPPG